MSNKVDNYEHYVPEAKVNEHFPGDYKFTLVKSIDQLKQILSNSFNYISFDTETNSLDPTQGFLVGFSFCFDGIEAFYVPVKHFTGGLGNEALKLIYDRMVECKQVFMYNARFDCRFMEYAGFDMSKVKYHDVQLDVIISDTNWKKSGLKWAERHFLGWQADTFEETIGDNANFYFVEPEQATFYAATDALGTFALAKRMLQYYKEGGLSIKIENQVLYPLMKMEDMGLYTDVEWLKKCKVEIDQRLLDLEKSIYQEAGYTFEINSNKQKSDALASLGITTGAMTKTGNMAVSNKVFESLLDRYEKAGDKPPKIIKDLVEYSKLFKLGGSYVDKLISEAAKYNNVLRFSYKVGVVPCLTKDNYVTIKGKGMVSISEVVAGDEIWTQYGFKRVLWNDSHYSDDVYKITLKNGTHLTGTGHHPVLVDLSKNRRRAISPEWSALIALKPGEHIIKNSHKVDNYNVEVKLPSVNSLERESRSKKVSIPTSMSPKLARLFGFIDGDGSIVRDGIKLCFSAFEPELVEAYCSLMEELFSLKRPSIQVGKDNTLQVKYCSKKLVQWFTDCNLRQKLSDNVSPYIMHSSIECQLEYLRGLFDADGSVCIDRNYIQPRVKTNKPGMMFDVFQLCQQLGMNCLYREVSKGDKKPRYVVSMDSLRDVVYFYFEVGQHLYSCHKRENSSRFSMEKKFVDISESSFVNIEKVASDIVYDIEVEDVHEYVANGIVTHNTGRLACGTDRGNSYFASINLQSIPKPHPKMWYYRKAVPESNPEHTVLGYEFSLEPFPGEEKYWVEGKDPHLNVRNAFPAGEGRYWVSIDYSAQELVIPANLTLDPGFLGSFLGGGDCHKDTAIAMFGEENYDKEKRKIAKTFNFGLLYGMSTYSVADRYHISLDTAEDWVARYKLAHKQVFLWVDSLNKKARKEGSVYNYFGRPRRVKYYLQSSDPKMRSFGYRTVVNTSVQSVGADCTKLALIRYWDMLYNNPKYIEYNPDGSIKRRKTVFASTIHDEVNSLIDKDVIYEGIKDAIHAQRFKFKNWPVPMNVGLEVGNRWGECFPFKVDQDTGEVLGPDGELAEKVEEVVEEEAEHHEEEAIDFNFDLDE